MSESQSRVHYTTVTIAIASYIPRQPVRRLQLAGTGTMTRPAVFVAVLSLMSGPVAQSSSASDGAWPFLFDVGALNASVVAGLSNASGRVQFGAIFECPHPCGLIPSIAHLP